MLTLSQAIDDLYHAKLADNECDEVECDLQRFVQQVQNGFKIRVFDLRSMQIQLGVLARVPKFFRIVPNIHKLDLYANLIRDEGLQKVLQMLQSNPDITRIDVGCNDLTDGSALTMCSIIKTTNLKSLQLGRHEESWQANRFTREGLSTIVDCISETNTLKCFGIAGLSSLNQKKSQQYKDFSKHLSKMIAACTNMRTLDICDFGFVDADQAALADGFKSNKNLRFLDISKNSFPTGTKLVESLTYIDSLRVLNLSHCSLTEASCDVLADRISKGWQLINLNLSENPIGSNGIKKLLDVLVGNESLVWLNLAETSMNFEIADNLHNFISHLTILQDLDLSRNNMGDDIAAVFGNDLIGQNSLISLSLATCRITDKGSLDIMGALTQNTVLKHINLSDNFLSMNNGFDIVDTLQPNESLTHIDVSSNQIDVFATQAIQTLCQRNKQSRRDKVLQNLRKEYIQLSIQSSKLPNIEERLVSLRDKQDGLKNEIGIIAEKLETYDVTSQANLAVTNKAIDEFNLMIHQEQDQIDQMKEDIEKLNQETDKIIAECEKKAQIEDEKFRQAEAEATKIETETQNGQAQYLIMKEQLENEIANVEHMIAEINENGKSELLKFFEIPEYPYPDEIPPDIETYHEKTQEEIFEMAKQLEMQMQEEQLTTQTKKKKKITSPLIANGKNSKALVKKPTTRKKKP